MKILNKTWHGGFPNDEDLLLVKAALKKDGEALKSWQDWSARHVLADDVTLDRYRTLPLVFENLNHQTTLPTGVEGAFKKTFFVNSQLLRSLSEVREMLAGEGIPIVVMKGMGLVISGLYPRLGSRFQFDYDFLVPFEKKEEVIGFLEKKGFQPWYEDSREAHLATSHSVSFFVPGMPKYGSFDVHWLPISMCKHLKTNQLFFENKIEKTFVGQIFYTLPPELHLLQVLLHGIKIQHTSFTQWVCDAAVILEGSPSFDWAKFTAWTEELQASFFVKKGLQFLEEKVGIVLTEPAKRTLELMKIGFAEPYIFNFHNKEEKGIADLFFGQLHDLRQMQPGKSLPSHLFTMLKIWRASRHELSWGAFIGLIVRRLGALMRNKAPVRG